MYAVTWIGISVTERVNRFVIRINLKIKNLVKGGFAAVRLERKKPRSRKASFNAKGD